MRLVLFPALAVVAALAAPLAPARAAVDTLAIWNQIEGSYGVYPIPYGFATQPTDLATITPLSHVGFTRHPNYPTRLLYQNVPTSFSLNHYLEFTITPKAWHEFEPAYFRNASIQNLAPNFDYEIRTSLDNYQTVYGDAFWNHSTARNSGTYRDFEVDLSDMPALTGPTTFRIYHKDTDNLISATASTATWPYGWQLYGGTTEIPEPATATLLGLAALVLTRRRR